MAQLPDVFKHKDHEKMGEFSLIPKGTVAVAKVVKSEIKPTNAGDGKRLNIQFQIQEGEYKNKRVFVGLNIANPNPVAVEISQKELASICEACGKASIKDTQELHDIPIQITIGIEEGKDGYDDKNVITKYEPKGGTVKKNPFAA